MTTTNGQIVEWVAEVEQLREELQKQWKANHDEQCQLKWPHKNMLAVDCYWPRPKILEATS